MVEKCGVKMTKEILPSLVNIVVPVGLSRTSLSRGVQVSLLFYIFHEIFQVSHPPANGIFGNAINSSRLKQFTKKCCYYDIDGKNRKCGI